MVLLAAISIVNLMPLTVSANNINITGNQASDAIVKDKNGQVISPGTALNKYVGYNVSYNWTIPNGIKVMSGDTSSFYLPDNVQVSANTSFDVYYKGIVIGTFNINAGQRVGTLTYNAYLSQHPMNNITGTLTFGVNGKETSASNENWHINKVSWINKTNGLPVWNIAVNPQLTHYDSLTINDTMSSNQKIDPSTITVLYGHYDSNGNFITESEDKNFKDYTINGNEITFNFHNVDRAINIVYQTVPTNRAAKQQLQNTATMIGNGSPDDSNNGTWSDSSNMYYQGNGNIDGNLPSVSSSSVSSSSVSSSSVSSSSVSSSSVNSSSVSSSSVSSSSVSSSLVNSSSVSSSSVSSSSVSSSSVSFSSVSSSSVSSSSVSSSSVSSSSVSSNKSSLASSSKHVSSSKSSLVSSSKHVSSSKSSLISSSKHVNSSKSSLVSSSKHVSSSKSSLISSSKHVSSSKSSFVSSSERVNSNITSSSKHVSSNKSSLISSSKHVNSSKSSLVGSSKHVNSSKSSITSSSKHVSSSKSSLVSSSKHVSFNKSSFVSSSKYVSSSKSSLVSSSKSSKNENAIIVGNNHSSGNSNSHGQNVLPQTGNNKTNLIILGIILLIFAFGFVKLNKKRKIMYK